MVRTIQFLILFILIASCGKDETTGMNDPMEMEPIETLLLLKETTLNGELYLTYEYNPDSTLSKQTLHSNGAPSDNISYTYSGATIETVQTNINTGAINQYLKYSKINDSQGLRERFDSNQDLSISNVYTFDDDPCGYSAIDVFDANGTPLPSTTVEYNDENCSSIFYSQYGNDEPYIRWEYTRNDKFDAYNSTLLPFFRIEKQRGVTKLIRRTQDGTISTNLSYDAMIEYNEFDFPIKETRTFVDGDVSVYTYEYY